MFTEALAAARFDEAQEATSTPTNQQILKAAQSAYASYQHQVDALSSACGAYVAAPGNQKAMAALAAYPWSDGTPGAAVVAPIVHDSGISHALDQLATSFPSCQVGVSTRETRDIGLTTNGMWSETTKPDSPDAVVTAQQTMVTSITVGPGPTLAVGVWVDGHQPTTSESGFAIVLSVPAGYALAIAVTSGLAPWGFLNLSGVAVGSAAVASVTLASVSSVSEVVA